MLALLSLSLTVFGGKWLHEHSLMTCYKLHINIYYSHQESLLSLFCFSFFPPLSSSFCFFFWVKWGVLACMSLTWWNLYTKLSSAIQNVYGIAFSSSWHPLSFVLKIFQMRKETLLWRVFEGCIHTILAFFLTKRQVTRSILRVSGSMASH